MMMVFNSCIQRSTCIQYNTYIQYNMSKLLVHLLTWLLLKSVQRDLVRKV